MAKKTALVIDYEPRGLEQICAPLRRAGFTVATAGNGVDGIAAFERLKPDVTLLEAMLPKRHGFEVAQDMKSTPHGAKSAVIIVTAVYKGRKYRTQALHHYGCDAFLEKPVDPEQLIAVVRGLVGDADTPDDPQSGPGDGGISADTTEAAIVDHLDEWFDENVDPGDRDSGASPVAFDGTSALAPAPVVKRRVRPREWPRPRSVSRRHTQRVAADAVARQQRTRMAFLLTLLFVCLAVLVLRTL